MTYPHTFADDRWAANWDTAVLREPRLRLSYWVEDPLERAMVLVIVALAAYLAFALTTAEDPGAMTARDACVVSAVDDARAFARVLGDDRPVPYRFAERSCAQA